MRNDASNCAKCPFDMQDRLCKREDGNAPPFCPTQNKTALFDRCLTEYEKTEFNVLMGLCVGHDSLLFQYATAPCTVLAVKDRMLGHNPLAAVYNVDSYYRYLKKA